MRVMFLASVLGIVFLGGVDNSQAAEKVSCKVLTIEASHGGQGIDSGLKEYTSVLRKPPFSTYDTFRLVHQQSYAITLGKSVSLTLPGAFSGKLNFNKVIKKHLDLTLTITRPSAKPIIINGKTISGAPFFAAGLKSKHGRWVFGIICNKADKLIHY